MENMIENQIEIMPADQREIELLEKPRKIAIRKLFTQEGMDLLIAEIEKEVADFSADITTKEGRAKIVSMAAKIAKCKSPVKNLSMELKEDSRKFLDSVNTQWNRYELAIDNLRDKIRKPVDEIEVREAKELKERQDRLAEIQRLTTTRAFNNVQDLKGLMGDLEQAFNFYWGDFEFAAKAAFETAKQYLESEIEKGITYEKEQAELARLRIEKAERDKKDHEDKIAREAIEKERKDSEIKQAKIEEDRQIAEQKALIAERKAQMSAIGLCVDRMTGNFIFGGDDNNIGIQGFEFLQKVSDNDWKYLLEKVSSDITQVLEQRAAKQKEKAIDDAKKAAAEAVEKERLRVEEEKRKEDEAAERREKNKRHRAKINNESVAALAEVVNQYTTMEPSTGDLLAIIEAIAKGEIAHIQINY